MNAEAILARLKGVRRSGDGWVAHCPAHDDRNPSLSVAERGDKVLLFCHAGCTVQAVCSAIGIATHELMGSAATSNAQRRIVAHYDYTDESGVLLYQTIRFDPKDFRQRRPDGSSGWTWNLNGTRRVLYRLPEVLVANAVIVCEGEKDVETGRVWGLVATCNPMGAGKWSDEYSDFLRGRHITVIVDADEPGRKHAQRVAASLFGKAKSVKLIEFADAKDLSDWVEHGGNRDALMELIRNAPMWKPLGSGADGSGFNLTSIGDLLSRPKVETDWLWEGRLSAGTVSGVFAKPKVGKSTLARNLALAVSRGEPFLGFATKKGLVVYLALEERAEDLTEDFRLLGAAADDAILIHADSAPADGLLAAVELVHARKPALVVVDPLFRLARIRDEKAYGETYAALGPLIDIARTSGTHVLLVHHSGKSKKGDPVDSPLGSTAIGGAVSTLVVLRRTEAYRLISTVQRIGLDLPETVLDLDIDTRELSLGGSKFDTDRKACEKAILEFLRDAEDLQTQAQIRGGVEGQTKVIRAALTALVCAAKITKSGEGTKGKPFLYGCPNSGSQDNAETTKPESQEAHQGGLNSAGILVSDSHENSALVHGDDEVRL